MSKISLFDDNQELIQDVLIQSPIYYMGNKFKLLPQLLSLFPASCNTFLDLFGGSATVCLNYQGKYNTIYNELNENIYNLVLMLKQTSPKELLNYIEDTIKRYNLHTLDSRKEESENAKYRDSFNIFRDKYNNSVEKEYKDLFILSLFSITHLIRFNSNNEFNGSLGLDLRLTKLSDKITYSHKRLQNIELLNFNCLEMDLTTLTSDDFVYLDPPYSNTLAVYNEKRAFGGWTISHDLKLFSILDELTKRNIKWGMSNVFSSRGSENSHLIEWSEQYNVAHLDCKYHSFFTKVANNDEVYIYNY